MKRVTTDRKNKTLAMAKAIAKRAGIQLPTEVDIQEADGQFFIELDLPEEVELPIGLERVILSTE